jgi:hypothetical protein
MDHVKCDTSRHVHSTAELKETPGIKKLEVIRGWNELHYAEFTFRQILLWR